MISFRRAMRKLEKEYPVFKCFPREDGIYFLQFWCPYCKKWHRHGMGSGHRVAHCGEETPLRERGYIIEPYTKGELLRLRKLIDVALECKAYGRKYDEQIRQMSKGR